MFFCLVSCKNFSIQKKVLRYSEKRQKTTKMGNTPEKPSFDNDPFIRILLNTQCGREYDAFNVCVDKVLPNTPEYAQRDENHRFNVETGIKDENLKQRVKKECYSLVAPLADCVSQEAHINEVVTKAWETILNAEPSSIYQIKCRWEYDRACKCQTEAGNNNYNMSEYCKQEIADVTRCTGKILAAETKSEYRTTSRQFTL
jgi:hypothetical protein